MSNTVSELLDSADWRDARAVEGRDTFLEKRPPGWSPFPWQF